MKSWDNITLDTNGKPILPKEVKALHTTLYVKQGEIYKTINFPHNLSDWQVRHFLSDKGTILVDDGSGFLTYYDKKDFEPIWMK